MKGIMIRRPKIEEIDSIHEFFTIVLKDTFERNDLNELKDLLEEEIIDKKRCLKQDFDTFGKERFFLFAIYEGQIIGSIEYGISNDLMNECTNMEMKDILEIGTVFVLPKFQKKCVGSTLLYQLFHELDKKGIKEFCFDSGYKKAQKTWCRKFGNPSYFLEDYWGEGAHHMVWRILVKDALNLFGSFAN